MYMMGGVTTNIIICRGAVTLPHNPSCQRRGPHAFPWRGIILSLSRWLGLADSRRETLNQSHEPFPRKWCQSALDQSVHDGNAHIRISKIISSFDSYGSPC